MPQRRIGRRRLGEVLGAALTSVEGRRSGREQQIRLAWVKVCGAAWAAHGVPLGLTPEGFLRVGVWDPAWRETFFEERRALTRRLRGACPWIRGVRLEQAEAPAAPPEVAAAPPLAPRPETHALAHDPPLREALDRLLAARDRRREGSAGTLRPQGSLS